MRLSELLKTATVQEEVVHEIQNGMVFHKVQKVYHVPAGIYDCPIEVDITEEVIIEGSTFKVSG